MIKAFRFSTWWRIFIIIPTLPGLSSYLYYWHNCCQSIHIKALQFDQSSQNLLEMELEQTLKKLSATTSSCTLWIDQCAMFHDVHKRKYIPMSAQTLESTVHLSSIQQVNAFTSVFKFSYWERCPMKQLPQSTIPNTESVDWEGYTAGTCASWPCCMTLLYRWLRSQRAVFNMYFPVRCSLSYQLITTSRANVITPLGINMTTLPLHINTSTSQSERIYLLESSYLSTRVDMTTSPGQQDFISQSH